MIPAIWTVGHLTVDDVIMWDGGTAFGTIGGAALYAAVGASAAGHRSHVATRVGDGFPREHCSELAEIGIEIAPSAAPERCIAQWVLYEQDGSRTYLLHPGSGSYEAMSPSPDDFPEFTGAGIHIAPMPVAAQRRWCEADRAGAMCLTLDPHTDSCLDDPDEVLELIPSLDAFLPSEIEATALTGTDPVSSARFFHSLGARIAVVKLGASGCIVATVDGVWRLPCVPVEVIDTTGAGDAFCGAFMSSLAHGADGVTAARIATAAASIVVESRGAWIDSLKTTHRLVDARARALVPELLQPPAAPHSGPFHTALQTEGQPQ